MEQLQTAPAPALGSGRRRDRHGRLVAACLLITGQLAGCLLAGPAAAAPTPISSLPFTISQPGAYQLTGNLTYSGSLVAILITASNVTLTGGGFTLTGPGGSNFAYGIRVSGASQVTITGTKITGFGTGIYLENVSSSILSSNTASNNSGPSQPDGILLFQSSHNTLTNNTANGNANEGIRLLHSDSNALTGNTANSNTFGIELLQSQHNTLHGNTANGNLGTSSAGFHLGSGSDDNTVDTNTSANNPGVGISVDGSSGNTLHGNVVSSNGLAGIDLDIVSATLVEENNAAGNQVGIRVTAGSVGNTLLHNTAQRNTMFDLEDDNLSPCQNGWANNLYVTDNEMGLEQGPMFGCIR